MNQECKVRCEIINVNSDEPVFYPFSIKASNYSGSCYNINDPFAKLCVLGIVKNVNIRVFKLQKLMKQDIKWHEKWKCKSRLDASVCNNKQRWNNDKCSCECKELIDKSVYHKGFIWNPSNCECKCNKFMWCWRVFRFWKLLSVEKG